MNRVRVIIVVLDSVGIGAMPDADAYGDVSSNTLGHVAEAVGGLVLPNLAHFGLGNIVPISGVPPAAEPKACYGKMSEKSAGKDTTIGHWELAGIVTSRPFPLYPQGFPPEIIKPFERMIDRETLGNYAASGTEIIKALGEEHVRTGYPIVYTSADSVFQIAAHEKVIPVEQLYEICRTARGILTGEHAVARVIARPFVGEPGNFQRTEHRKDFSLEPPEETLLDAVVNAGKKVIAIGKIEDVFAGHGITRSIHTGNNHDGIAETISVVKSGGGDLIFTNLVDFDMLYGHRNDPVGYARALEEFDSALPQLLSALYARDILIIAADHGCDPTMESTDHNREYVPLLVTHSKLNAGIDLGVRSSFCDVSATVREALSLPSGREGVSFLANIEFNP